jgi:hypothetical protein
MEEARRRGRPTVGERVPLGLRVTPELKRRLDAATRATGRSQSQEAEVRLERSFDRQDLITEVLSVAFDRPSAGIILAIGHLMHCAGSQHHALYLGDVQHWTEDPAAFDDAVEAALTFLQAVKPRKGRRPRTEGQGQALADALIKQIWKRRPIEFEGRLLHPRSSVLEGHPLYRRAAPISSMLGPIAKRLDPKDIEAATRLRAAERQTAVNAAAEAVLGLINSSPRTPSRDEVAELLSKHLSQQTLGNPSGTDEIEP